MKKAFAVIVSLLFLAGLLPVFAGGGQEAEKEIVLQWPCIWVAQDSKAPTVKALVDQFNADNAGKIKVVIEPNPDYDGYRQKINTSMRIKAFVLVCDQHIQKQWIHLVSGNAQSPNPVFDGIGSQKLAISVENFDRRFT